MDGIQMAQVQAAEDVVVQRLRQKGLIDDEPTPLPNNSTPIWDLVIADMRERDRVGRE